jgi:hypothetical protein
MKRKTRKKSRLLCSAESLLDETCFMFVVGYWVLKGILVCS